VLALGLAVALALASIATFPCWPYSERWGYKPSIATGILLILVAVVAVAGRLPRPMPSQTSVAVAPLNTGERDPSRKVIYLPRDLETTQRETGL
jgi:hypothetical protein